ncbi:DUF3304 domain-containing protein [Chromobacterium haemolyticum]|uniref:DUF3304 domain-containing protein n=1 Tax=Chromobacterium fluminis TaxID=3044269 RepID=A0ABX0LCU2_9NEIS|nr:DUF3304 domain-containing protein [Chromobacterium haemolyticum]NHR07332.1 DUF3304 domain-containing protein [Chromobacterium haemolyticum]
MVMRAPNRGEMAAVHMPWLAWAACGVLALGLAACQNIAPPKTLGAGARVVNTVAGTSIVHASFNGQSMGGGGGEECCVSLPEQWRPGMTATIEWVKDPSPELNPDGRRAPPWNPDGTTPPEWQRWMKEHQANYVRRKVTTAVPRYETVSSLVLVFLPCDEVYPLIDSAEQGRVFGGLRGLASSEWDDEVIRRLGAGKVCAAGR